MIISAIYLIFLLGVVVLSFRLLFAFGAPYAGCSKERIDNLLALAGDVKGKTIADLGSGDGRVLIAFAKAGARAHGFEINPLLVIRSRRAIRTSGLEERAVVHWQSFWGEPLGNYDIITLYGISTIMRRLEKKLTRELKPGNAVLSVYFKFPTWRPSKTIGDVGMYML
ncbi:MAG: hypothetical protein HY470_01410 [Candidatus Ryanbacteria bacterium]|nr:hypothetical protein [Candidatus Ryanbacteria bacterium]